MQSEVWNWEPGRDQLVPGEKRWDPPLWAPKFGSSRGAPWRPTPQAQGEPHPGRPRARSSPASHPCTAPAGLDPAAAPPLERSTRPHPGMSAAPPPGTTGGRCPGAAPTEHTCCAQPEDQPAMRTRLSSQSPYLWGGRESNPRAPSLGARDAPLLQELGSPLQKREGREEGELTWGAGNPSASAILGKQDLKEDSGPEGGCPGLGLQRSPSEGGDPHSDPLRVIHHFISFPGPRGARVDR